MTGGHICLANVVCMLEVSPLAPIEQCQPMVALNSIGSKPTPAGDIVLRTDGHFLQQLLEAVSLGLARECMLALVVLFLIRNYYFFCHFLYYCLPCHGDTRWTCGHPGSSGRESS